MGVRIEHGKPSTLIAMAKRAGEAQAAIRAQEKAEKLQAQQIEFDYRTALRQQDMAIDLQMQERAKMWEIEKMELRSRGDFEREERFRQQKLDEQQAKLDALEKAYDNGRGILDKESYETAVLRETTGVAFPFPSRERPLTPKQQLQQEIAGWIKETPNVSEPGTTPAITSRIRVISPEGQSGTIEEWEWSTYEKQGFQKVTEKPLKWYQTPAAKEAAKRQWRGFSY